MPRRAALLTLATLCALAACQKKSEAERAAPRAPAPAAPASAPAGDRIVVGLVASLSGQDAGYGLSARRGTELAVADVNARGGVKGRQVRLEVYDNQGKAEESAVAATRLITQDKVAVLLGELSSSRSLAMAPLADKYAVPMVSAASTHPKVTLDGDRVRPYVFRVCFIDPFQGTVMARFARETLQLSKIAILRDSGNDYSMGIADVFAAELERLGGRVVGDESYKSTDQDFKAQLTAIRGKAPQALFVPGYYTDVALIARQARELGMQQPLLGGDAWDSAKLVEIGGKAVEGSYYSNHYTTEDPSPRIQSFVKRFREAYGEPPDSLAAQSYDAAAVAFDAMARAADLGGPAIRDALERTRGFEAVTGVISLDEKHNAVKPAVILKIEGGDRKYVATVAP
jgi:branched-chain amino acid transport system substrate-binding protein